jgi:ABC-type uncharacterized transport system substrate-binding protein
MKRREFITLLGSAVAWPLAARAQQPMPVIGFMNAASPGPFANLVAAFRKGLEETGYVEGRNVSIEYRWAEGRYDRLPAFAAELVGRPVTVLVATGGEPAILAAKAATTSIPIVFATGADPVARGFVASFNRPGGNVTGVSFFSVELGAKRLGLLRELRPEAARIAVLVDPTWPLTEPFVRGPGCGFGHWAANRSPLCQQRPRNRDRLYDARPTWGCRVARRYWHVLELPTGADCRASGPT